MNVGKSKELQDILFEQVRKKKADLLIVSEQYRKVDAPGFYQDKSRKAVIPVLNPDLRLRKIQETHKGFI